jgi:NADH-quinone oxidoreductase subunit A
LTAYLPILTMICLVVVFIAASFTVSQLLGPRRPNAAKQAPYESGIVPEQEPSERFPVKFYLVAMTFIVLDVEIVFLLTLLVPFAYLLSTGALDWGPAHKLVDRVTHGVLRASGKPGADGLDPTAVAPERDTEAA